MSSKTAFVIDDDVSWRTNGWIALQDAGYEVKQFATVDAALEHLGYDATSGTVTGQLPSVIVTDNDTMSNYKGLDLLRILKDKGVGLVMLAGSAKEAEVKGAGGENAALIDKLSFALVDDPIKLLIETVNKTAEAAILEKLNLARQPGGRNDV
jgi:DNA-binding NtrC family response regulator